jgi:hypothetical protein
MLLYGDRPNPARCFTGTVCSFGICTFLVSIGFSARCMIKATPEACSLRVSLLAVNCGVWGLILIIVGGICLAFYDCFRIKPSRSRRGSRPATESASIGIEERWKPRFNRLSSEGYEREGDLESDDGMLGGKNPHPRGPSV